MLNYNKLNEVGIYVNNVRDVSYGIYIGRGSILGNPFKIGKDGDRNMVIAKYRDWLWGKIKEKGDVFNELCRLYKIWLVKGRLSLGCYCFPKACHGLVIGSCLIWLKKEGGIS